MIRAFVVIALLLWGGAAHAQVMATGAGPGSAFTGCVPIQIIGLGGGNSGSASAVMTTVDVPAGSTVVVFFNVGAVNQSGLSLKDSQNNTYTLAQSSTTSASIGNAVVGYNTNVAHIPVNSTFTATTSNNVTWNLKGAWISCTTGAADQIVSLNSAANNGVTLTTGTLASNTETAFAYAEVTNGGFITTGPGFTNIYTDGNVNDIAYRNTLSTAPVSFSPTWTTSAASSTVVVTFQQGGCAAYTALALRMDGTQNVAAVQAAICALGPFLSSLDGLVVLAASDAANAKLNWVQNAFNPTTNGTLTFTANNGYTGDGATGFLNTGFNPSTAAGHATQNSTTVGVCVLNNRTTSSLGADIGAQDASQAWIIQPFDGGGNGNYYLNDGFSNGFLGTTSAGVWEAVRAAAGADTLYRNVTQVSSSTVASTGLPNANLFILANSHNGSTNSFSPDQVGYVFWGAALTTVQLTSINNILHAYLGAVGTTSGACGQPTVTAGATVTYTAGGAAVTADSALTVVDSGPANLRSATVSITAGFLSGDQLNFNNQNGIIGSYNSGTGVLTLSGSSAIANYQTALASITYSSTAVDPTNAGANPSRTLTWVVTE